VNHAGAQVDRPAGADLQVANKYKCLRIAKTVNEATRAAPPHESGNKARREIPVPMLWAKRGNVSRGGDPHSVPRAIAYDSKRPPSGVGARTGMNQASRRCDFKTRAALQQVMAIFLLLV